MPRAGGEGRTGGERGGEGGRYRPKGFPSQVFRLLGLPKSLEASWSEGPEIPLTTASGAGRRPGLEPEGQGHSSRTDQRTWAVLRDSRRHWGPCLGQGGQCSPHPAFAAFLMSPESLVSSEHPRRLPQDGVLPALQWERYKPYLECLGGSRASTDVYESLMGQILGEVDLGL